MGREQRRIRREKERAARKAAKKAMKEDRSPDNMLLHLRKMADSKQNQVHFAQSPECTIALTRQDGVEIVGMVDATDVLFQLGEADVTAAIQEAKDPNDLTRTLSAALGREVTPHEVSALADVVQTMNAAVEANPPQASSA